ncbi:Protein of unknown function, partial [Gryllus bimaculatus]
MSTSEAILAKITREEESDYDFDNELAESTSDS